MWFVYIILLWLTYVSALTQSNIYWTNVTEYTSLLVKSDPCGRLTGGRDLFVCKVWIESRWISGSYTFINNTNMSACSVVINRSVHKSNDFQVFLHPPSSTSWVPFTGKYPDKAVVGGDYRDGSQGYVCRAEWEKSLLVGISYKNSSTCNVALGSYSAYKSDKEIQVQDLSKIELLTKNSYAAMFDENFPKI